MKTVLSILALCLIIVAASIPARSEWTESGVGICEQPYDQDEIYMIPDGAGGAFLVWQDLRGIGNRDIYAQKIDADGNPLWTTDGVAVCLATGHQYYPQMVSDGADGVIITWQDMRGPESDIYAQRLDESGNPLWTADGIAVSTAANTQSDPRICSDGSGGAIIVWEDWRNSDWDIYGARIDQDGNAVWTVDGVVICDETGGQLDPVITANVFGGAVVAWIDYRAGNSDIYAQWITSAGSQQWDYWGAPVCTDLSTQRNVQICNGPSAFTILTWEDYRNGEWDIYAECLDGIGMISWGSIPVCTATGSQADPRIEPDGNFGVYIAWYDGRNYGISSMDIYAQRFSGGGAPLWTLDGTPVCAAPRTQQSPRIARTEDGLLVTWMDYRNMPAQGFIQKMDLSGTNIWASDGIPAVPNNLEFYDPRIIDDGAGGAIVAWEHSTVSGGRDIFASRVERYGNWGYPAPVITAVRDVPGDQGGYINLAWEASRLDPWPEESIAEYTVWRAIDEEAALAFAASGAAIFEGIPSSLPESAGPIVRMESLASGEYFWKLISTLEAHQLESYSEVVPSLFDSTAECDEQHYFQIIAYSTTPGQHWVSDPDSGYSVDNLAPTAPLGLAGEQMFGPDGLQLTWDPNTEPDLVGYSIYRGTSGGFEPGPGNFVASTPDTASFDGDWDWSAGYWYKVSAVDIHGNESIFAVLGPDLVTGDDPTPLPDATFLSQNFPNPFNPTTTIAFGLKTDGFVTLTIYDAAGRLVATLINESMPAGQYAAVWNGNDKNGSPTASGVYFYRLITKEFEETKKMILLR